MSSAKRGWGGGEKWETMRGQANSGGGRRW